MVKYLVNIYFGLPSVIRVCKQRQREFRLSNFHFIILIKTIFDFSNSLCFRFPLWVLVAFLLMDILMESHASFWSLTEYLEWTTSITMIILACRRICLTMLKVILKTNHSRIRCVFTTSWGDNNSQVLENMLQSERCSCNSANRKFQVSYDPERF